MKPLTLILTLVLSSIMGLAQTLKPAASRPRGQVVISAVANQLVNKTIPALAGETGCSLQVFGKAVPNQGWKLSGSTFSATPTKAGFYHLKIVCSKPTAATQSILLMVSAKPAAPPKPPLPAQTIPLN